MILPKSFTSTNIWKCCSRQWLVDNLLQYFIPKYTMTHIWNFENCDKLESVVTSRTNTRTTKHLFTKGLYIVDYKCLHLLLEYWQWYTSTFTMMSENDCLNTNEMLPKWGSGKKPCTQFIWVIIKHANITARCLNKNTHTSKSLGKTCSYERSQIIN